MKTHNYPDMECKEEIYSGHAVRQMFARKISRAEVSELLRNGEAIEEYKDDKPFPPIWCWDLSVAAPCML